MRVYIETYGCQMNVADTELIVGILGQRGFEVAASAETADVILLNTCAVREKAEERIFGRLGWIKPLKRARPQLIVGVAGCMAEHLRDRIADRAPFVDVIVGPDAYRRLPELIEQGARAAADRPLVDVRLDRHELYAGAEVARTPGVSGYITVMRGCDRFCSFCIVPYVRGRERSVSTAEVLRQARQMAAEGFREVVLLGQRVSSYRALDEQHEQQPDEEHEQPRLANEADPRDASACDFAGLLSRVHAVAGLERIRFTAPYPSDFTPALLETLAALPRVERHLHLPLQSGSTQVLAAMRRGYTADAYRELCRTVRSRMPEFSITTDVIVGYPGETEDDFRDTLDVAAEVEFDHAYMFAYSERSLTHAARHAPDDVPLQVKHERLQRLIALQEENSRRRNAAMVGRIVEVLVEGPNPKPHAASPAAGLPAGPQAIGRTSCFRTTVVAGEHRPGELVHVRIAAASVHTLYGVAV